MSLITPKAHDRMYGESLHDQLAKHRKDLVIARGYTDPLGPKVDRRVEQVKVEFERRKNGLAT